jgi:hypothetical protein
MKPHEPDIVSLIWGGLFLVVVAGWVLAKVVEVDLPSAGWIFAALMIAIGAVGLFSALRPKQAKS